MDNFIKPECLSDNIELNTEGKKVYSCDCLNLPICSSYGKVFIGCYAGAFNGNRCSHGDKMQIRILNSMNPNAIVKNCD
ncbi:MULTISPECIES: hypothetical protein [Pectinatus]|uniref:hypothetical protein n=1 Tax=Pectinatus TaxID=864 RepID=UPI0018C58C43|nr:MULTISPECIES: hypothetical protein [Pectinatus]